MDNPDVGISRLGLYHNCEELLSGILRPKRKLHIIIEDTVTFRRNVKKSKKKKF